MDRNFQHRVWERTHQTYRTYQSGPRKGQPKTVTDRVVRFLIEGLHLQEIPSKNRYRQFRSLKPDNPSIYFVGKAGAVKSGKTASDSISLTTYFKRNMEMWEKNDRTNR